MFAIIDFISDSISFILSIFGSVLGFISVILFDIPKLLISMFNNLPGFFQYGLTGILGVMSIFMVIKFITLLKSVVN